MFNSSNILIKYILLFCNIITLCFVLHTKQLLANTNEKDKNTELILKIISLAENNKLQQINKLLDKNSDVNLDDLVNWLMISNKNIEIDDIEKTIKKYEGWPDINNLVIDLEEKTDWNITDNILYKIYEVQKPITRIGKIKYANYLINNNNNNLDQKNIIIENWINGSFNKENEKYIYKKFSYLFDEKDNIQRLDNLIFKKKWASAYRQIKRVSNDYQILSKAKIKLSRKEYGVDYAIKIIPEYLKNDSGLVYERVKWRRTSGLPNESYQLLLNHLNKNSETLIKPSYWWKEINWHTRNLLNQKKYQQAYYLLVNHQQTKISNIANAEWLLGWISLEFLEKPDQALKHFLNMRDIVKMPISISRANYWLAKTEKYLLNEVNTNSYYGIASKYNTTFYGLLSNEIINNEPNFELQDIEMFIDTPENNINKKLRVLGLLSSTSDKKYSLKFINGLFKNKLSKNEILQVLKVLKNKKRTDLFIRACKKAIRIDKSFQKYLFPYPYNVNSNILNDPLIMAIAKQESEFYPNARSSSGALGIVQLMPSTAKSTAKKLGIKYNKNKLITDIEYNLYLGSKYLYSLMNYYEGSTILAIASYNAGPTNVNRWIKLHGDPRDKGVDLINWIELIPFTETRNYVQRVVENYIVYQQVFINIAIKNKTNIKELFLHEK